jgi:hypothetical protein
MFSPGRKPDEGILGRRHIRRRVIHDKTTKRKKGTRWNEVLVQTSGFNSLRTLADDSGFQSAVPRMEGSS